VEGEHVAEAKPLAAWDKQSYATKQQAVAQVRKDFQTSVTDISTLASEVTTHAKKSHQITSLAVQAAATQMKNITSAATAKMC